jgi:hypothetical protein
MKRVFRSFAVASAAALLLTACQKDAKEATQTPATAVSDATLAKIKSLGFDETGARKVDNGYLVEGDIILTEANLSQASTSPYLNVANEEQYRTTNLVTGLPRTIRVRVQNLSSVYVNATQVAVDRYNSLVNANNPTTDNSPTSGTRMSFLLVGANEQADITIVGFYEGPSGGFITLGSAGFPSGGNPYTQIKMNTHEQAYGTNPNLLYVASVIQHEIGHCIGFRHTDYATRSSCGKRRQNEGTAGVGAVWVPGTPTGADPNSWMLACSNGGDRSFNSNDKVAMNYLY